MKKSDLEKLYLEEGLSTSEIAKQFGLKSKSTVGYWLKKHKIPTRKTGGKSNYYDINGQRFGKLFVKEKVGSYKYGTKWRCICDCGNVTIVSKGSLTSGATQSCGCKRIEMMYQGCENLSGCYWSRLRKGASSRGLQFEITIEEAWNLFEKQNRKCAITGDTLTLERDYTKNRTTHTGSLDRIDNSKGYTINNVQWVHKDVNIMHNKRTLKEFVSLCRKVVEHHDSIIASD